MSFPLTLTPPTSGFTLCAARCTGEPCFLLLSLDGTSSEPRKVCCAARLDASSTTRAASGREREGKQGGGERGGITTTYSDGDQLTIALLRDVPTGARGRHPLET